MAHIFISYAHKNRDFTQKVIKKIQKAGFNHWIDREGLNTGIPWREAIDQAILEAFALLLIVTPEALQSQYVNYEWSFALGASKTVIPILYMQTSLPKQLERLQYLNFFEKPTPWERLLNDIQIAKNKHTIQQANNILQKPDNFRCSHAIETLREIDHPDAKEVLAYVIENHERIDLRIDAAFALSEFRDKRAIPGLLDALKDKLDERNRIYAAQAISKMKEIKLVPELITVFQDEQNSWVRADILNALGELEDPLAIRVIVEAIGDRDHHICRIASRIISQMQGSFAQYASRFLAEHLYSSVHLVRETALDTFVALGNNCLYDLIACLDDTYQPKWAGESVCEIASRALIRIGTPEALAAVDEWRRDQQGGDS